MSVEGSSIISSDGFLFTSIPIASLTRAEKLVYRESTDVHKEVEKRHAEVIRYAEMLSGEITN